MGLLSQVIFVIRVTVYLFLYFGLSSTIDLRTLSFSVSLLYDKSLVSPDRLNTNLPFQPTLDYTDRSPSVTSKVPRPSLTAIEIDRYTTYLSLSEEPSRINDPGQSPE